MFHHLRIKIWYAAAPFPGTTTYQKFLWIAIPNGRSYQKVINWPRGAEKWVRASARKRRLAAACGKPNALLAPPKGWETVAASLGGELKAIRTAGRGSVWFFLRFFRPLYFR